MLVTKTLTGYVRRDGYGRLLIDACATDLEHLVKEAQVGEERRTCRKYIEDLFPASFDGKRVEVKIEISMEVLDEPSVG